MKHSHRSHRVLAAALVAAALATGPVTDVVGAGRGEPSVPSTIRPPAGNKVFLVGHAVGVQIYACGAGADGPRWTFVAPRADLFGDNGKLVTTHFGGPTWQARDGSTVTAARVDGVTVDATAIPCLLLSTVSAAAGSDGDRLTATTFIQRTRTTGGVQPPATACTPATLGTTAEVPYTADYHFWKRTG